MINELIYLYHILLCIHLFTDCLLFVATLRNSTNSEIFGKSAGRSRRKKCNFKFLFGGFLLIFPFYLTVNSHVDNFYFNSAL